MFPKAFWRDVRFLQILAQVIFILALAGVAGLLYANVSSNLARAGMTVGYDFLKNPASFDIGETYIPYQSSDSYLRSFIVGLINTLVVSAVGIVFATIVGVFAGIARLSTNWLIRQFAAAYVGVIRNTPLLIQLMFWYFGVILQFPGVKKAIPLPGPSYLSSRGIYIPWPQKTEAFAGWTPYLYIALISIIVIWLIFKWLEARRGRSVPLMYYLAYLFVPGLMLLIGFKLQPAAPLIIEIPALAGFNFKGGLHMTPEFAALLFGLVVYTGAFIAEIVRAGIQAVSRGQMEAALSLGLTSGQTLRLVVMPQAVRVIVPPMTSQYLNLAKNTSLAIAIGFPDLFSIAGTIFNQTGAAIETIVIMMLSYLSMSLFTSLIMNIYNNRTRLVER